METCWSPSFLRLTKKVKFFGTDIQLFCNLAVTCCLFSCTPPGGVGNSLSNRLAVISPNRGTRPLTTTTGKCGVPYPQRARRQKLKVVFFFLKVRLFQEPSTFLPKTHRTTFR